MLCLQLTEVNRKGTKLHTFGGLNLASWDMSVNMKLGGGFKYFYVKV